MSTRSIDIETMRAAVRAGQMSWSQHAADQMLLRGIARADALYVLSNGERIEDYPDDHPWPSALFLGYSRERAIHIVAGQSPGTHEVAVITAYEPDEQRFEADMKTRKPK